MIKKKMYHGIVCFVDKSGTSLISPTAVRFEPSAGASVNEGIPIDTTVKPTSLFLTTS